MPIPDLIPFAQPRALPLSIPAGKESTVIPVTGRRLYIKEASYSDFSVRFDQGQYVPCDLAMGFTVPAFMAPFQSVQIKNEGANDLSLVLIVWEGQIDDNRVNLIESRNGSAASEIPNGWNFIGGVEIPDDASRIKIADASPNRARLLVNFGNQFDLPDFQPCLTNGDNTNELWIPEVESTFGASIKFRQVNLAYKGEVWAFDRNGSGAGALYCYVSELCYS